MENLYDEHGFSWNGIHKKTRTIYDQRGFLKSGIHKDTKKRYDQFGYDIDGNKQIEEKIPQEITSTINERNINGYDNINFTKNWFSKDLIHNKELIENDLDQKWGDYNTFNEKKETLKEAKGKERAEIKQELFLLNSNGEFSETPPNKQKVQADPYFFFCTDHNLTYISSHKINIHEGNKIIIPFTNARAHKLRFEDSGNNKFKLLMVNGKIKSIQMCKYQEQNEENNIKNEHIKSVETIIKERNNITGTVKKTGIGDISKLLKSDQDEIMSAPTEGVTLISGVAGSGKTNVLLHRVQYLLWEQPGKKDYNDIIFHETNILFLCFNVALKNYIKNSIKDNFPDIKVNNIDAWFKMLWNKSFYVNLNTKIDSNVSLEEIQIIIQKWVDSITVENIKDCYIEKSRESYEFKDGTSIKKQGVATITLNPSIMDNLFGKVTIYTNKHYLTRLYLLSITNIIQDKNHPNTFVLKIGGKEFSEYLGKEKNKETGEEEPKLKGLDVSKTNHNIKYFFDKPMYDHIFIDEVQDLSKIEIQIINGFHKNSMTIAGDESQLLNQGELGSDLSNLFGIKIDHKYELKTSHRTSQQNALLANAFLKDIKIANPIESISFSGNKPLVKNVGDEIGEMNYLISNIIDLRKKDKGASICVLFPKNDMGQTMSTKLQEKGIDCYWAYSGTWDFTKQVHITNYFQAKGLEFDYVFICGINGYETRNSKNKNNVMYTLITRGIKRVFITIQGKLPKMFNDIDSDLYEYKDIS